MEDIVKEWLGESDYKSVCHGRVLLSDLFVDFVHWCGGKRYDVRGMTSRWLANILSNLGYEKIRRGDGIVFVVGK